MHKKSVSTFFILCSLFSLMAFISAKPKRHIAKKTVAFPAKKTASDTTANPYYIIIDKSDYELKVYDEEGWYATYPVVFGGKDLGDKMKEGDRKTPNGS